MTRQEYIEALNIRMEELTSAIDWALDNEDHDTARRLRTQLDAVRQAYNNI